MLCCFERLIYPRSTADVGPDGYMVASYRALDRLPDLSGHSVSQVKVVGHFLPTATTIRYEMRGCWERSKYGMQFAMTGFEEIIAHTKEGSVSYLSSGLIKGIGEKTAERIYDTFGERTLDILDNDPDQLLSIKGISRNKLNRILESYLTYRGARDVIATLTPHGVSPNRAIRIYKAFGRDTMRVIREHPYQLCRIRGIGFATADGIAKSLGLAPDSDERVDAGILETLREAETGGELFRNAGSLCIERNVLLKKSLVLLNTAEITETAVLERMACLLAQRELASYHGQYYREPVEAAEKAVAESVHRLLSAETACCQSGVDAEITFAERKAGVTLAPEQRHAVRTCLTAPISIITGGPGTGKTMLERIILDVYGRLRKDGEVVCCAPTGRAARRMEESTGHPASTIHRQLGLIADDEDSYQDPVDLTATLVLVDEISMLDVYLAKYLFHAIPSGCQMILIGDADQLPSVGPGAILSELIACDEIPVMKLDKVYRQSAGSRIAINASLIRHNTVSLEYGSDFELVESATLEQSAAILEERYLEEVQARGIDHVALLSPFRSKTETGVNALNDRIREKVNPPAPGKHECQQGRKLFREGDKVMQTRNKDEVSNGDIGYITSIRRVDGEWLVYVDFGDGRSMEYGSTELDALELAYASTIHKSQGSEYKTVLLTLQTAHYIMLKRPLLYTAITRARDKVIIVGERKAICMAIGRTDAEKRGTMLAERIREQCKNQKAINE